MIKQYTKPSVNLTRLTKEISDAIGVDLIYVETVDDQINVHIEDETSQQNQDALDLVISNHVGVTIEDIACQKIHAARQFGNAMMEKMASENVAMGITQAGKSGDVLAIFSEKVLVPSSTRPISAMDTVQSGTLYVLIEVLDYHIANMANYSDLSPYITTERLNNFKAAVVEFLS